MNAVRTNVGSHESPRKIAQKWSFATGGTGRSLPAFSNRWRHGAAIFVGSDDNKRCMRRRWGRGPTTAAVFANLHLRRASFFLRPSSPPSEHFCPPPSSPASCPLPSAPHYSPNSQEEEVEIESAQASCTAGDADRSRISSLFARGRGCGLGRGGRLASEHGHRRLRR